MTVFMVMDLKSTGGEGCCTALAALSSRALKQNEIVPVLLIATLCLWGAARGSTVGWVVGGHGMLPVHIGSTICGVD